MRVRTDIKAGINGLGDLVAEITQLTGLDNLAKTYEQVSGKSCGCDVRQEKLNQLFPFKSNSTNL